MDIKLNAAGSGATLRLFYCGRHFLNWIKMHSYVFLGVLCVIAQSNAQQYGQIPQRPQYVGAGLVQQPVQRQNFRQRQNNVRALPDNVQPIQQVQVQALPHLQLQAVDQRLRRPQPLGRARVQYQPQVFEQQRGNQIEDSPVQYKNKLPSPTPLPQFQQQTQKLLTPRPVTEQEEANEDDDDTATTLTNPSTTAFPPPARFSQAPQPNPAASGFQRSQFPQAAAFRPQPQPQPIGFPESATLQGRQLIRPQLRPLQQIQPQLISRPPPPPPPQPQPISKQSEESDEEENEQPFFRQPQIRPQKKQEAIRQQVIDAEPQRQQLRLPQVQRQQQQQQQQQPVRQQAEYTRPVQREPHVKASSVKKEKKPTVQTIRKFHEENEDGSITWGYENDDGSFKEETIGVDCVTRGKYGYFDPDGVKREYAYTTGIPCDKEQQEAEEAASANEGFIDYTNNKYVFPNGDEIDLEAMVKNRARKPVSQYRN